MRNLYVALSTNNFQQNGYSVIATGHYKNDVLKQAQRIIDQNETGIYRDTQLKNLIVVSKTEAKRKYNIDI